MNENIPLDITLRNKIEAHFDYKWSKDRNQAIDDEDELTLLSQIPDMVQNKLYQEYLYHDFLGPFRDTFKIFKPSLEGEEV